MKCERARRGRSDKSTWIAKKQKLKRMKREDCFGKRKSEARTIVFDVSRQTKTSKTRCKHNDHKK